MTCFELDEGERKFGGLLLVVNADDGSCSDGGVRDEHSLELGWCYLEAFVLDEFFETIDDAELTRAGIDNGNVSGSKVAVQDKSVTSSRGVAEVSPCTLVDP